MKAISGGGAVVVNLACRFLGSAHILAKPAQRSRQLTSGSSERQVMEGLVIVGGSDVIARCAWQDKVKGCITVLGDPFGA